MAKLIELTRGYKAIVDDEDYERLSQYSWYAHITKTKVYARRREGHSGPAFYMHRELLSCPEVDHQDGDGLNNRKSNLRAVTHTQNMMNRSARRNGTSRYKGVHYYKARGNWMVGVNHKFVGYFDNENDAAMAYNLVAYLEYGEHAKMNEAH